MAMPPGRRKNGERGEMLERLLLIDDLDGEALYVKGMLRAAGFAEPFLHINDAEEAMAYFEGGGKFTDRAKYPIPDLVLLDLKMPGVDGFQFLKWLRSQPEFARVIVVVLTGEADPKKIQLAYQLGANSFLAKNANLEEFRNFVEFFRGFSRVANRLPPATENPGSRSSAA